MTQVGFRLPDRQHAILMARAAEAGQSTSAFVRTIVLEQLEPTAPDERIDELRSTVIQIAAIDERIDELRSTVIQIAAMLAVSIGKRSPDLLEQGLADGRILLEQRGLLERSVKP